MAIDPKNESGTLDELVDRFEQGDDLEDLDWEEVDSEPRELEQISVRLVKNDLEFIRALADRWGIGYTNLIRMAVRDFVTEHKNQ